MSESPHLRKLLLVLSGVGARVFRNQVGNGWFGKLVRHENGTAVIANAKMVTCGLTTGSSDIVGWTPIVVTADMVGSRIAIFTAIEAKVDAAVTEEQRNFLRAVSDAGGIALVVRNEGAIPAAVEMVRQWPRMPGGIDGRST